MKHFSILLITLCFSLQSHAQLFSKERLLNIENFDKKLLSWGYFLGFNSYDYNFDYFEDIDDIIVDRSTGFNVGLIGNLRISDHVDLRLEPGLYLSNRELFYRSSNFPGQTVTEDDLRREIKSTNIHIPLLVKLSTERLNNFKPFVVGGVSVGLNLASNEDNPEDNSDGVFRVKKYTYYYEVGFGVDIYLYFFKFTPSIRGIFAFNDELIRDNDPNLPWTRNIKTMKTRGVFINFTFQ